MVNYEINNIMMSSSRSEVLSRRDSGGAALTQRVAWWSKRWSEWESGLRSAGAGVLTGVRGRVGRLGRRRRLGGVGRRARASGRRRRIFRGAGGGRRRRAGGRRAERDQPQQRHAPPPEHGGQRAGSAPDAARGPLATEIRAPLTRAPASSFPHPGIRAASGRLAKRRGCARAATRRLGRRSRERTTAPEHYFGSDAPRRCRRPPAARCQFYAKLRAGGDAICTTPRPPASALPVHCSITFCRDLPFSLRGFFARRSWGRGSARRCFAAAARHVRHPSTQNSRRRTCCWPVSIDTMSQLLARKQRLALSHCLALSVLWILMHGLYLDVKLFLI